MTTVIFEFVNPAESGEDVAAQGVLTFSLFTPEEDAGRVRSTRDFAVPLVGGRAEVELSPTSAAQAWQVQVHGVAGIGTMWKAVTDSDEPVRHVDLIDIDPMSLSPLPNVVAAWAEADANARRALELAENGATPEQIESAVTQYLTDNPVEAGLSESDVQGVVEQYMVDHPVDPGLSEADVQGVLDQYFIDNPLPDSDLSYMPDPDHNGVALLYFGEPVAPPEPTAPSIISQPSSVAVNAGSQAVFQITVAGYPTPAVQWQVSDDGLAWSDSSSGLVLTTAILGVDDSGRWFRAVVSNASGTVVSNAARVTVNEVAGLPVVVTHPESQTVLEGSPVTFEASATGSPVPVAQWQRMVSGSWADIPGETGVTYSIAAASPADAGAAFRVVFTNGSGSVTTDVAILTVTQVPAAPVITKQPGTGTSNYATDNNFGYHEAELEVRATGFPAPGVMWDTSVNSGSTYGTPTVRGTTEVADGETIARFVTSQFDSVYRHRAHFTNSEGSVVSAAGSGAMRGGTPSITTNPSHVPNPTTYPETVSVVASNTGFGTPTFTWYAKVSGNAFTVSNPETLTELFDGENNVEGATVIVSGANTPDLTVESVSGMENVETHIRVACVVRSSYEFPDGHLRSQVTNRNCIIAWKV